MVGPAVNFIPEDVSEPVQRVEWLVSGCTAYPRSILLQHHFAESFSGYSFAEDVHLSTRVARSCTLLNATRARVDHKDLGKNTHQDWARLGEMMVVNRHAVMAMVLERRSLSDYLRLLYFELVYGTLSFFWLNRHEPDCLRRSISLLLGRMRGADKILRGQSPHAAVVRVSVRGGRVY
jgi:hypothetical protein